MVLDNIHDDSNLIVVIASVGISKSLSRSLSGGLVIPIAAKLREQITSPSNLSGRSSGSEVRLRVSPIIGVL